MLYIRFQWPVDLLKPIFGPMSTCTEFYHQERWFCNRLQFRSVQSLSHVQVFVTLWTTARQASLSITNSWCPPKPMSIESVMPSSHLILCRPLLFLPSIFPSISVFSNESGLRIRWPKYWSFSFNISPSNEHPGLISFRMDWLDLLAVQGTLKHLSNGLRRHKNESYYVVQVNWEARGPIADKFLLFDNNASVQAFKLLIKNMMQKSILFPS